jgi:diacylglycerol kinase family enzyme
MHPEFNPNSGEYIVRQPDNHFDRVVVLFNPYSTRVKKFDAAMNDLIESGNYPEVIFTTGDDHADHNNLVNNLREGDALVVWGGDGTGNIAANALLSEELVDHKIPILYLWGGNGLDAARQTNGSLSRKSPSEALLKGRITIINPLLIKYGDKEKIAVAHSGICTMAHLNSKFNDPSHRGKPLYEFAPFRLIYEGIVIGRYSKNPEEFTMKDADGEQTLNELFVTNGSTIAKVGRFALSLREPRSLIVKLDKRVKERRGKEHTDYVHLSAWLLRLVSKRSKTQELKLGDKYKVLIKNDTIIHFDGEPELIEEDIEVEFSQHDRTLHSLTTL